MQKIFTHENRLIVENVRNLLREHGIESILKNEYGASAAGELSTIDTWPEVWVADERHYDEAKRLVKSLSEPSNESQWTCGHCGEVNEPSFESCWQCKHDKPL